MTNNAAEKQTKPGPRTPWPYIAALVMVLVYAYGGSSLSNLGMDWGYETVKHFVGQPKDDDNQFFGALFLTMLAAPAIYVAMAISILKGSFGGSWRWQLLLLPTAIVGYYLPTCFPFRVADFEFVFPYVVAVTFAAICLSFGFDRLYRELARRTNAKRLLATLFLATAPAAMPMFLCGNWLSDLHNALLELAVYCGLLFVSAFWAPLSIRAQRQSAAFSAVFFASFPVIIFNLTNVVFATLCHLAWQALASTLLISLVTLVSITLGGICGCIATRYRYSRT
jgi:hypothetical protein